MQKPAYLITSIGVLHSLHHYGKGYIPHLKKATKSYWLLFALNPKPIWASSLHIPHESQLPVHLSFHIRFNLILRYEGPNPYSPA